MIKFTVRLPNFAIYTGGKELLDMNGTRMTPRSCQVLGGAGFPS